LIRLSLGSILQSATGSTFPNVSKEQIYSWSWDLPPIEQQMRIVEILGSLDDKIELNRRMNETLEQMAMALYKYWFVDFGPFSDIDENGLPIGWRWGTLEEIGYTYKDQVDPTELDYQLPYIGLEHMPKGSISLEEWEYSDKVSSNKFLFDKGDILFGKLRPYFKKVGVAPVNGVCSTDILVIRPKSDVFFGLLFAQVIQDEFIDYCSNTSNGTKMPRCDWNQMAKFKLPIPSDSVLIDFNKKIKSFVEQVISNIHENRMLIEIRDFLLPRLLSGEIEVREAEEQVEEVLANA
ncbi:restriction endonuclease subunit S, partial [Thermobacillus sp. ZCTH02-B1]|uniref:restriction endonuclease subunit S n=1 Tax=Thermobacillus sp. ZCTH02-B1 TaxID=1858795 RepID=UPI0026003A66